MLKSKNGITLLSLTVAIILILILAGVGTYTGLNSIKTSEDGKLSTELLMVQHAVLEEYTKYSATSKVNINSSLVGVKLTDDNINNNNIVKENLKYYLKLDENNKIELKDTNIENYYLITKNNAEKLGIVKLKDEYIVNYTTGEAINKTKLKNNAGEPLYVYSVEKELEYVQNGLIVHYDGINNTGNGHNNTANIWKDLSKNGNDGKLYNFTYSTDSEWKENCLSFNGTDNSVLLKNVLKNSEEMTIEFVYTSKIAKSWQYYWGIHANRFGLESGSTDYRSIYYSGNGGSQYIKINGLEEKIGKKVNNTIVFDKSNINAYKNSINVGTYNKKYDYYTQGEYFGVGTDGEKGYPTKMDCYSFRIYNRALTEEEVKYNYDIDKERFNL